MQKMKVKNRIIYGMNFKGKRVNFFLKHAKQNNFHTWIKNEQTEYVSVTT